MRTMTSEIGLQNLAAHWPVVLPGSTWHVRCKPDLGEFARRGRKLLLTPSLGPKFYIATADTANQGSTLAHVVLPPQ